MWVLLVTLCTRSLPAQCYVPPPFGQYATAAECYAAAEKLPTAEERNNAYCKPPE